ncbi:P87 [Agrotis ipsilon multiple nucleopolyhedrovirus]|uniref:VP80 n=1 Tax=Agrotis ipsilon multiple nucleopolyhedrovirus TaxID=208013 RepID=B6D5Y9_9ABAC|nr:P87 [Agrotis ipsilon multiple nucleopolyhedrovirus]ACI28777.1 VP80 [Agrotis ipsilon multiple nucleopolyhedrovirus]
MDTTANTIAQNSFDIKLGYAQRLAEYLMRLRPQDRPAIKALMKRVDKARHTSLGINKFALDNIVQEMHSMLPGGDESNVQQPSTSRTSPQPTLSTALPAPLSEIWSMSSVINDDDNDDNEGAEQTKNNDDDDNDGSSSDSSSSSSSDDDEEENENNTEEIERDMSEIKTLLTSLLESNSLQSLTRQSLLAFSDLISNTSLVYEDYFKDGIELDSVDCNLHDALQKFVKIFEKYGPVRCVVTDVEYYAERVRADRRALESLPPSVRAAVVTILDIVERKSAYTVEINMNPVEFNAVKDNTIRALLNRYSEQIPIQFNTTNATIPTTTTTTTTTAAAGPIVADMSTDEEEREMTQTMRRKRKIRASAQSLDKSSSSSPAAKRMATAASANAVSDEVFIDNVRQMHQANVIVPKLIMQVVSVMPSDVPSSLLTCPTNGLGDAKLSANNYNTTIAIINKMNLTVITENVYFYKLLEPLAHYGSDEALTTKVLWFIARAAHYFTNNARNYNYLRDSLRPLTDDVDRVALFMIRYNFLWFYRQFLAQLLSSPTTSYQSQKIINVLRVYASVVQKEYNKLHYDFNQTRVYVGPVDNVVKLMVVSLSDILA